ncbi:MAG: phosphoribosylformylglycinamidine synthase, partial [Planctomycetes bacterium]|nr:phosphoribosylformylglycinamidine synthase [Planctomycetota bacterium]
MLWHYEIATRDGLPDPAGHEVDKELAWLGLAEAGPVRTSRLYLLGGELDRHAAEQLAAELLCDAVVQSCTLSERSQTIETAAGAVTVCRRAGVMDPVEESLRRGAARLGHELALVRTGLCHRFGGRVTAQDLGRIAESLLANPVIDEIHLASAALPVPRPAAEQDFELILVELGNDDELMALSREKGLSLNLEEMRIIRDHFQELGRLPTDIELETLAQTWSEHCKHKTFTASVEMDGRSYQNLLKETVFAATRELDRDWCVSVFSDNAGIIRFDDDHDLCIKVETHNHPSAIEPYGGAGTGLGGVIRDILGTGLGGKPVANLDVFCVGEPDARDEDLPAGVTHPLRILKGIVAGVRDYGNRMGIPTVAGAVLFDERYTGNPLVYAGTVGLIPHEFAHKEARPGDHIVVLGGRTGRDGIHGATFSSRELHEDSETLDGGAVQIGNAITEKRMMDVLLLARDRKLYSCLTDCGAGGFSSAVGEIAETTGARVDLGAAPLKYPGLSYREIWLSEAQERMVLTVPPRHLAELLELCASEDVETCVLGEITDTGHLEIAFHGE